MGGRERKRKRNDEKGPMSLGRLSEERGEEEAAGPLIVCVPEKVQRPLLEARYWRCRN